MDAWTAKLEKFAKLSDADKKVIRDISADAKRVGAHEDLIREGERPRQVHLLVEGFACRYKILEDGGRQIVAFLVPGDLCDVHVFILGAMDHSIGTISPCRVAFIERAALEEIFDKHPAITRALWWATLVDEAVLREWLANMGRRPAEQRIAHVLCEVLVRLQAVGLATENSYDLPLTQNEIADTMGLSDVHVNRTLQRLRSEGLIELKRGALTILEVERLKEFSGFNQNYLHLQNSGNAASHNRDRGRITAAGA